MTLGKFIVIEGIDGAGTTTQAALLTQMLQQKGLPVIQTAEPSNGPIGMMIRSILTRRMTLPEKEGRLNQKALTLLFAADRLDHLETVIRPALEAGTYVICDRYSPSTFSYQGVGVSNEQWLTEVDSEAIAPDIIIYLKISVQDALARIHSRRETEIFEKEEFLTKVITRYDTYIQAEEKLKSIKVLTVNGMLQPNVIANLIWQDFKDVFC